MYQLFKASKQTNPSAVIRIVHGFEEIANLRDLIRLDRSKKESGRKNIILNLTENAWIHCR